MSIRVQVTDLENGDTSDQIIEDGDYALLCVGDCYLAHTSVYPTKGTHVLTIKGHNVGKGPAQEKVYLTQPKEETPMTTREDG